MGPVLSILRTRKHRSLGLSFAMRHELRRRLVDADQVYKGLWSHADRKSCWIDYVVQPVTRVQINEYDDLGPRTRRILDLLRTD
jgi:hypothetical protein